MPLLHLTSFYTLEFLKFFSSICFLISVLILYLISSYFKLLLDLLMFVGYFIFLLIINLIALWLDTALCISQFCEICESLPFGLVDGHLCNVPYKQRGCICLFWAVFSRWCARLSLLCGPQSVSLLTCLRNAERWLLEFSNEIVDLWISHFCFTLYMFTLISCHHD